jgi:hypothetical protein
MLRLSRLMLPALLLLVCRQGLAQAPPWLSRFDVPLPSGTRSVEVTRADEPVYVAPAVDAARRGTLALGLRLPIYAALRASGCAGRWLLVGPTAWVCESHVRFTREAAHDARAADARPPDGLPYRYYFVGPDGSLGYRSLSLAEEGVPDAELEPGFAVAVVTQAARPGGDPFALTRHGYWLPLRDLAPATSSTFHGAELAGELSVGFVLSERARIFDKPGGRALSSRIRPRFQALTILEEHSRAGRRWVRVAEDEWMQEADLRVPRAAPLPDGVQAHERWIDVDTARQVLTAYVGDRPVFATLVSTGKGREASEQATPKGVHRIWVKLASTDMDNLEDEDAGRYYAMQGVPWVMFFKKGYGLHGTYWHGSFGRVRSHGCVNLSALDAQRLFAWTSPRMPAGWSAVFPTSYEPGTLVRVR